MYKRLSVWTPGKRVSGFLNDVMFECKDTRQIMYKKNHALYKDCVWVLEHQANEYKQDNFLLIKMRNNDIMSTNIR